MKKLLTFFALFISLSAPALAQVEENYSPAEPRTVMPWIEWMNEANIAADMDFITGMRPHHEGALTMSDEYLKAKGASSERLKALSRGIIINQTFEIGVMKRLEELLKAANVKGDDTVAVKVAEKGQAQKQKFSYAVPPKIKRGPGHDDAVSKRDVQFAKAMIIHHQGALDMCRDYHANPAAKNGYLELLCLDIIRDQSQEIELMHDVIAHYDGDASTIKPSAVHGMEHMKHGTHHHGGH